MSYIYFDKTQLVNLEYSLNKETIRVNKLGAYSSSTIINCNTRKYHGLLVVPQPQIDNEPHVLLSCIDDTVIQHKQEFHLGLHKYPGVYSPKGHKYLLDFATEPIPQLTYQVGGVVLSRERLLVHNQDRVLIRYTAHNLHSPTTIRTQPFLAFRSRHKLSKANIGANKKYEMIPNGAKWCLYDNYTPLYIQFSKPVEFVPVPDWYNNIQYIEEKERGYEYQEDLYVPGYFEFTIERGETIILSAGTTQANPEQLKRLFGTELKRRTPRDSFYNCLRSAAKQFVLQDDKKVEIVAGYPWFGRWGRDSFIALPGLTLATDQPQLCKYAIDTLLADLQGPLFPNIGSGTQAAYNSVDAPLWFFWTLQQYANHTQSTEKIWKQYGKKMQLILDGYRDGTEFNIHMQPNGLIFAGTTGKALTWMDAVVEGTPVTGRMGCPVEINALWYNAVCFSLEMARLAKDQTFVEQWQHLPNQIRQSFVDNYWNEQRGYLADYTNAGFKDWSVRPNMVFATSLPYSPLTEEQRESVLQKIKEELLTPRGLRTLSPQDPNYKGTYGGDQATRDRAYHQGTVWPWLLGHFAEGYLKNHGRSGVHFIETLLKGFDETITERGIGTISEIFDGDPPHTANGAISQAWSVSELLRIFKLLEKYK